MATTTGQGKGNTGERILSTSAGLFARFGYNGVSTRDIAVAAGVNEVTVYRHFPRKRDLYLAVLDSELRRVQLSGDLLAEIAEAADVQTVVTRTFRLVTATLMRRPELLRLVQFSALEFSDDLKPLFRRHLGELIEVVARYVDPWISRGELRCSSAKVLILTLIAIVLSHRSLHQIFSEDQAGPEAMFETYSGVLWGSQNISN